MLYTSNTFTAFNYPVKDAEVIFLGVPFASTSISKPAIYGPTIVRESLKMTEGLPEKKFSDIGDLEVVPGNFLSTSNRIKETLKEMAEVNKRAFPVIIGGEHSITLPIVEELKPKTIIQFDAHSDTRSSYLGERFSHATWAYHASKITKIIQIGLNAVSVEENKFLGKSKSVKAFSINNFLKFRPHIERPAHLTIDMDVFDPSYVETGFPEGNLKPEDVFKILDKIKCDSLDITEIADYTLPSRTGFLAAQLIKKVLS